jgi:hypothetical protein
MSITAPTNIPLTQRAAIRATLFNWLQSGNIQNLNQVLTSFPKFINFQVNSSPGQQTRAAVVIFIQSEREERIAIGGAHNGWKRLDYTVILQVFQHSLKRDSQEVMDDFDILIDSIKTRLRQDHNFGDPTGNLVWQGAEPNINGTYGEPLSLESGATEIWAQLEFDVTQMIQA